MTECPEVSHEWCIDTYKNTCTVCVYDDNNVLASSPVGYHEAGRLKFSICHSVLFNNRLNKGVLSMGKRAASWTGRVSSHKPLKGSKWLLYAF